MREYPWDGLMVPMYHGRLNPREVCRAWFTIQDGDGPVARLVDRGVHASDFDVPILDTVEGQSRNAQIGPMHRHVATLRAPL